MIENRIGEGSEVMVNGSVVSGGAAGEKVSRKGRQGFAKGR
jgi:hypothetical protein